jgi:hypothetical protein
MRPGNQAVLFVACIIVLVIGVLAVVAVRSNSEWATFVPDLIVGVVTAGGIAGLIALVQVRAEGGRERAAKITSAYENLLDALTDLRIMDIASESARPLAIATTRMLNLSELVRDDFPEMPAWFEAERQLGMSLALMVGTDFSMASGRKLTVEEHLEIQAPFSEWLAEYQSRLRYWRSGRITREQMVHTAVTIEKNMRNEGTWVDPMGWRK